MKVLSKIEELKKYVKEEEKLKEAVVFLEEGLEKFKEIVKVDFSLYEETEEGDETEYFAVTYRVTATLRDDNIFRGGIIIYRRGYIDVYYEIETKDDYISEEKEIKEVTVIQEEEEGEVLTLKEFLEKIRNDSNFREDFVKGKIKIVDEFMTMPYVKVLWDGTEIARGNIKLVIKR